VGLVDLPAGAVHAASPQLAGSVDEKRLGNAEQVAGALLGLDHLDGDLGTHREVAGTCRY
jgi:hypothetical protein